ncbi:hypothetical protein J2798_003081 [Herbaspirillum seropedicae]|nr:hypothetical protein [Herbaspirillum seropedicae]
MSSYRKRWSRDGLLQELPALANQLTRRSH